MSGSVHRLKLALMYGSAYEPGFEHTVRSTDGNGSRPKDGSVPCYKPSIKKAKFLEGKISLATKHNPTLMHRMADEYDNLLRSLGVDDTMVHSDTGATANTDATSNPTGDESLLDVDDEDEVCVLDPPLLPVPATDPVVNSHPETEKVNVDVYEFMNVESDSEDQASQNTQSTIYTMYSKF
jgi:hypothetical protein